MALQAFLRHVYSPKVICRAAISRHRVTGETLVSPHSCYPHLSNKINAMPSILSPTSLSHNSASRSYTPLADEINPEIGNTVPSTTVSHNGTIVYAKRSATASSSTSTDPEGRERESDQLNCSPRLRSDSQETLSPGTIHKGKEGITKRVSHEEADLGELRREHGKGKEKHWDLEQGRVNALNTGGESDEGRYPPLNEIEEEERRIREVSLCFAMKIFHLLMRNFLI